MYNRAFLFNGIGSKLEKLICNLTPELREKYETYKAEAFSFLGINSDLSDITIIIKRLLNGCFILYVTGSFLNISSNKE